MIDILWMIVNVAFAALVWFRIGRQQAFDKLLHDYKELAKICQIQELIIKSYKQKYGELTDEETKGKN